MTPEITLSHDHIVVEGHRIERPERLSPSQWLEFWDCAGGWRDTDFEKGYSAGYARAMDEWDNH